MLKLKSNRMLVKWTTTFWANCPIFHHRNRIGPIRRCHFWTRSSTSRSPIGSEPWNTWSKIICHSKNLKPKFWNQLSGIAFLIFKEFYYCSRSVFKFLKNFPKFYTLILQFYNFLYEIKYILNILLEFQKFQIFFLY